MLTIVSVVLRRTISVTQQEIDKCLSLAARRETNCSRRRREEEKREKRTSIVWSFRLVEMSRLSIFYAARRTASGFTSRTDCIPGIYLSAMLIHVDNKTKLHFLSLSAARARSSSIVKYTQSILFPAAIDRSIGKDCLRRRRRRGRKLNSVDRSWKYTHLINYWTE